MLSTLKPCAAAWPWWWCCCCCCSPALSRLRERVEGNAVRATARYTAAVGALDLGSGSLARGRNGLRRRGCAVLGFNVLNAHWLRAWRRLLLVAVRLVLVSAGEKARPWRFARLYPSWRLSFWNAVVGAKSCRSQTYYTSPGPGTNSCLYQAFCHRGALWQSTRSGIDCVWYCSASLACCPCKRESAPLWTDKCRLGSPSCLGSSGWPSWWAQCNCNGGFYHILGLRLRRVRSVRPRHAGRVLLMGRVRVHAHGGWHPGVTPSGGGPVITLVAADVRHDSQRVGTGDGIARLHDFSPNGAGEEQTSKKSKAIHKLLWNREGSPPESPRYATVFTNVTSGLDSRTGHLCLSERALENFWTLSIGLYIILLRTSILFPFCCQ